MEHNEDPVEAIFEYLIAEGAIELQGMSPSGEPTFRVTEKCEEIFPEFYEQHKKSITDTANELWRMGLVEIVFAEDNLEDRVIFKQKNYEVLKEVYEDLTIEQVEFLQMLGAPIEYFVEKKTF